MGTKVKHHIKSALYISADHDSGGSSVSKFGGLTPEDGTSLLFGIIVDKTKNFMKMANIGLRGSTRSSCPPSVNALDLKTGHALKIWETVLISINPGQQN